MKPIPSIWVDSSCLDAPNNPYANDFVIGLVTATALPWCENRPDFS